RPYVVTITGVPKNPALGTNSSVSYSIRVRNVSAEPKTQVLVTDFIPSGLEFINSSPPPTNQSTIGNSVAWLYPTIDPGDSNQITFRAGLLPTLVPGTVLEDLVNVTDADGNVFDYSFVGHLRGVKQNVRPLTMSMVTVRKSFPGSQVRYTINI